MVSLNTYVTVVIEFTAKLVPGLCDLLKIPMESKSVLADDGSFQDTLTGAAEADGISMEISVGHPLMPQLVLFKNCESSPHTAKHRKVKILCVKTFSVLLFFFFCPH